MVELRGAEATSDEGAASIRRRGPLQRAPGLVRPRLHGARPGGRRRLIAVLLVRGGPADFRWSFLLMVVATVVDATDGTLARKVRIKEAVPSFDGRRLDDIIDFLTYTFLPSS